MSFSVRNLVSSEQVRTKLTSFQNYEKLKRLKNNTQHKIAYIVKWAYYNRIVFFFNKILIKSTENILI